MKRIARKRRRGLGRLWRASGPAGGDRSPWRAHVRRERWYWIGIIISLIAGLVLGYFHSREVAGARRDCEARGGKLEVSRTDYRCVFSGQRAAP